MPFIHLSYSTEYRRDFAGIYQIIGLNTKGKYQLRIHNPEMKTKPQLESDQLTDENFFLLILVTGRQQGMGVKVNRAKRKVNGERKPFLNSLNIQGKNSCFK